MPLPMPDDAPVTIAVCPLSTGRTSHAGMTTSGSCSGMRSRIVVLLIRVIVAKRFLSIWSGGLSR
jgi:hypothetical protein